MKGCGQGVQALDQSWSRGVEEFVGDAVNAGVADGFETAPAPLGDNFFQWNAVASAAPGGDEDVGVGGCDGLCWDLFAGLAYKGAARSLHKLGNPSLRGDEGLAPFLAKDGWAGCLGGLDAVADKCNFLLHGGDDFLTLRWTSDYAGDGDNVGVDVAERMWGEAEESDAGFKDVGDGFELIWDGCDD